MILKIVQAGHPVLRRKARALSPDEIKSPAFANLVEMMRETMRDAPGVGLAAPQVGLALQVAVIEDSADYLEGVPPEVLEERQREAVPFQVVVNPRLTVVEAGPAEFFEGCLSLAGFSAVVPRALAVRVDALDEQGKPVTIEARGWHARILQHEIDHLNGKLYIDRMDPRTLTNNEGYSRYWSGKSAKEVRRLLGEDSSS